MNNERDTHFAGFAELVARELKEQDLLNIGNFMQPLVDPPIDFDYEKIKQIIAQRAYDLAVHIFNIAPVSEYEWSMSDIPDLTAWPNTSQPPL